MDSPAKTMFIILSTYALRTIGCKLHKKLKYCGLESKKLPENITMVLDNTELLTMMRALRTCWKEKFRQRANRTQAICLACQTMGKSNHSKEVSRTKKVINHLRENNTEWDLQFEHPSTLHPKPMHTPPDSRPL